MAGERPRIADQPVIVSVDKETGLERVIRGPIAPPIVRERFVATNVSFHRSASDYGREPFVGVTLTLERNDEKHDPALGSLPHLEVRLPAEYAGQFHAGQSFWLTINPAARHGDD